MSHANSGSGRGSRWPGLPLRSVAPSRRGRRAGWRTIVSRGPSSTSYDVLGDHRGMFLSPSTRTTSPSTVKARGATPTRSSAALRAAMVGAARRHPPACGGGVGTTSPARAPPAPQRLSGAQAACHRAARADRVRRGKRAGRPRGGEAAGAGGLRARDAQGREPAEPASAPPPHPCEVHGPLHPRHDGATAGCAGGPTGGTTAAISPQGTLNNARSKRVQQVQNKQAEQLHAQTRAQCACMHPECVRGACPRQIKARHTNQGAPRIPCCACVCVCVSVGQTAKRRVARRRLPRSKM